MNLLVISVSYRELVMKFVTYVSHTCLERAWPTFLSSGFAFGYRPVMIVVAKSFLKLWSDPRIAKSVIHIQKRDPYPEFQDCKSLPYKKIPRGHSDKELGRWLNPNLLTCKGVPDKITLRAVLILEIEMAVFDCAFLILWPSSQIRIPHAIFSMSSALFLHCS